jgi:hypothetical protein
MKGLKKVLLVAAIAVPFAAQAELKSIDDSAMADVSGQSGLVIEAGFGTGATTLYDNHGTWANAGIKIEAFKWEVDVEEFNATTNTINSTIDHGNYAGFIAKEIAIAGRVDVVIDAVAATTGTVTAGFAGDFAATSAGGGIGISFANSDIDFRVGDMGIYVADGYNGQISSMGTIEIIGMNINGLSLVIHGN